MDETKQEKIKAENEGKKRQKNKRKRRRNSNKSFGPHGENSPFGPTKRN